MKKIEELEIGKTYNFDVTFTQNGNAFAAKIKVDPSEITLTILTEHSGQKRFEPLPAHMNEITCENREDKFVLCELHMISYRSREICNTTGTWFQECNYRAKYLLYCVNHAGDNLRFDSLSINSPAIGKWVGLTSASQRILELYHSGSKNLFDTDHDLHIPLEESRSVSVSYIIQISQQYEKFQSGISFPPSFLFEFGNNSAAQAVHEYNKALTLLSFFFGFDPDISSIQIYGNFDRCTMYYPRDKEKRKKSKDEWILYPLGWDLQPCFNHSGLPSIPLETFKNYFDGNENLQDLMTKYITYRNMHNIEDRFLGYFRLLERICYKTKSHINETQLNQLIEHSKDLLTSFGLASKQRRAFEKAIHKANNSKYNTEKCISDFFETLPPEITEKLEIKKTELSKICKLRNDIIHANPYSIGRYEIYDYTNFIQSLLVCGLLIKLGIDITNSPTLGERLRYML